MTYPTQAKTLVIGKEAFRGTAVSPTIDFGFLVTDISDGLAREVTESMSMGSLETQKINSGIVDVGMSVSGEFQHGRFMTYVFGTAAHSDLGGGDLSHTFTVTDAKSLTIESGQDSTVDTVLTHNGQLIESCEFSIELNGNLTVALEFKGKSTTSSASATSHVISTLPVFPHAACTIKINAVAATEIQSASIKITKTVERSGGISSNLYQQGHETEFKMEFTATLGFQIRTFQELWLGGTTPSASANPTVFNFELIADNGVASGSGRRGVDIVMTANIGTEFSVDATLPGLIFATMSGKGILSSAISYDNIGTAAWA